MITNLACHCHVARERILKVTHNTHHRDVIVVQVDLVFTCTSTYTSAHASAYSYSFGSKS